MEAPWAEVGRAGGYDVVINATTRGQADADQESPVPKGSLRRGQTVMDIVYKPVRTSLVSEAVACGATAVHGGRMLLYQAAAQFEAYTLRAAPLAAMGQALDEAMGGFH